MPDPCFCALESLSSNPSRVPPTYTYWGYECDGEKVTNNDSTRTFNSAGPVAPEGTPVPNVDDPCVCEGVDYCRSVSRVTAEAQPEAAARSRAAAVAAVPPTVSPCDEHIKPEWQILGQWNARACVFPDKLLHLVVLGKHDKCCRLIVRMVCYVFDRQCLGCGCHGCTLSECDLQIGRCPNGQLCVWIGPAGGKQIGPFAVQNVSASGAR